MREKLCKFLRPRLALLLAALLLAAYLPVMPAAQAAGGAPASAWEDQPGVINESFTETGTTLDSYTYYNRDGTTETVTVDHSAELGSDLNPISIPDETALILFGKQMKDATIGKYYILDKEGGVYNMGAHTMKPLMGEVSGGSGEPDPSAPFEGVLIGNRAKIKDAHINMDGNKTAFGLFGALQGAEVADLTVSLTSASEGSSVIAAGGLVGFVQGNAVLTNCTAEVAGSLTAGFEGHAGGLVGSVIGDMALTNCTAEVAGSLTANRYAGGLVGSAIGDMAFTNCTAEVSGGLAGSSAGGLVGQVEGNVTLTNCTAEVEGGLAGSSAGGLVGRVNYGSVTLTDCAAQTVITGRSPSSPVGNGDATFTGVNVTTLQMGAGSDVSLALVNGTTLTLTDANGLTATGNAASSETTGSVEVTSGGDAEIQVHGGSDPDGRTYTLIGVNGTIRLEDKTGDAPAEYWVTLDAIFDPGDANPLAKGDAVNLLGEAGNRLCNVTVEAGTGGSVTGGSGTFNAGDSVTVKATPESGYRFVNWTKNGQQVSTEATYAFTVTSSCTLTAVFEAITPQYTVTVKAGTGGSTGGGGTFDAGTRVTVTATPDSGYRFVNWTEDDQPVSTEASYTFTVTGSRTLTAVFETITPQYTVTVQAGTGGSTDGGGTFDAGTSVTVTATPDSGYRFAGWTEDGKEVSNRASYTFAVTSNRTLFAEFEAESVTPPDPGHTHTWAASWSKDATHHWHECTAQGCDISYNSQKDGYAPHTPGGWVVDTPATSSKSGQRHKECTVCGYITQTETIPATGGGGSSGGGGDDTPPTYKPDVSKPGEGGGTPTVTPSNPKPGDTDRHPQPGRGL